MTAQASVSGGPSAVARLRRLCRPASAWSPRLTATVSAAIGLLALVDAAWPRHGRHSTMVFPILPFPVRVGASAVAAVAGFVLLRVAAGLRRRKVQAWRIAVGGSGVLAVASVAHPHHTVPAVVSIGLLAVLLGSRQQFRAQPDPASRWSTVRIVGQLLGFALAYGLTALWLSGRVIGHPSGWDYLREVGYGLIGMNGPVSVHGRIFNAALHETLLAFGLLAVVTAAVLALRPPIPIATLAPDDEQRLRDLLARYGGNDSLGYFGLRRDKSVVWSDSAKAGVVYRVVQGVALASGDPIGNPEAWPGAIMAYRRLADQHGLIPAVVGCSEQGATVFRRELRLKPFAIGDEAILNVADFSLDGRAMRGVRHACSRVQRANYAISVRRAADIPAAEFAELGVAAAAWRVDKTERGFSMALSRLGDPADDQCVIATAYDAGRLRGLLNFVPWGADGLSLDLMRRDRSGENGLNEALIAAVIDHAAEFGVARVSLNFAMFREALERGERIGAGPIARAWRRLLLIGSRWWQIDSLYRFNQKFQPNWQPRFVCYPAARDLPRITIAALDAEAFLVFPFDRHRRAGRTKLAR